MPYSGTSQDAIRARIRRLIAEKAEGTQQDLAEKAGIQPSMLSRLLSGSEVITRRYLIKLERAFAVRLTWLEAGIEPVYYAEGKAPERSESDYFEGSLLRSYLDSKGIEYADFARRLGKSKNTVAGYFKTESLSRANKTAILAELDLTEGQLFSGMSSANPSNYPNQIELIDENDINLLPVLHIPVSARAGVGYENYFLSHMVKQIFSKVQKDMLQPGIDATKHVVVEVDGDSMEPELKAGYLMLAYKLEPAQLPKLNSIVLVDYRGELIIKQLSEIDDVSNAIVLRSTNGGATRKVLTSELKAVYHIYRYYDAKLTL